MARLDKVQFEGSGKTAYQLVNEEGILVDMYDEKGDHMLASDWLGKTWIITENVAKSVSPDEIKTAIAQAASAPEPPKPAAPEPPKPTTASAETKATPMPSTSSQPSANKPPFGKK